MPIGKIIEIEGTDGSGKETQSHLLAKNLSNLGIDAEVVSFPDYDSPSSKMIKDFLHGEFGDRKSLTPIEISMLYAFDRSYVFRTKNLQEKLNNGKWIIFDRYVWSNVIYNTTGLDLDNFYKEFSKIVTLEYGILELPDADLIFYLHVPQPLSKKMIEDRGLDKDMNEKDDKYMTKVATHGLLVAEMFKLTIIYCVSSENSRIMRTPEQISSEIFDHVKERLIT